METQESLNTMPRIGDIAPDFEAVTTKGTIKFADFAKDNDYQLCGLYHEIYISDPRHENPEKERTILRYPIKK